MEIKNKHSIIVDVHQLSSLRHVFLVGAHKMRDEGFEMEDLFTAKLHSEFVQACEAQDLSFDVDVAAFRENLNETFENDIGRDSLGKQLVETITSLFEALRCLFKKDLVGSFFEEALPVDLRDILSLRERIFLNFARFKHENGAAEVSIGLVGDAGSEFDRKLEIFFLANRLK